jgi:hypothetical protein
LCNEWDFTDLLTIGSGMDWLEELWQGTNT